MTFRLKLLEKHIASWKNSELFPAILDVYVERYSFLHLCNDIFAGIKLFFLLFPILISLAIACGESPIAGLISGIAAIGTAALIGGNRYQINSISFPICALTLEIMVKYQYKGFFLISLFICVILYIFGRLKIGDILKYNSSAFLSAVYVYVALVILVSQLQYILGIGTGSAVNNLFVNIMSLVKNIGTITLVNIYYALSFIVFLIVLKLIFKGYITFFVYIILCTIIVIFSELHMIPMIGYINIKTIGVGLFNHLDNHTIFSLSYTLPSQLILENLVIFAFAISIVIASQVSTCTNIIASLTANGKLNINTELATIGISNLVSVSCGGLFISPDTELSIQNIEYKSKAIIAPLSTGALILFTWYFKDNIFQHIPMYAISSILIILSISVISGANIRQYIWSKNSEKYVFWSTLSIAMYFGFISAIFVGFVLSLFIFAHRMINIKEPSVYTNKNHDKSVKEFISNKYGYLSTKEIYKPIFNKVEIIQMDNILSLNILEKTRQVLLSCVARADFIIVYFKNIPFLDGKALAILKEFVKAANKAEYKVIICGTNGLLLEILQKKEKESNTRNVFGYIIPNFQDAINMILKNTKK